MKVMLLFPPQFDVTMPALALPCLTAVLRDAGHDVIQKDVNIESYDYLLSRESLEKAFDTLCMNRKNLLFSGIDINLLNSLINNGPSLIEEVENAKSVMRSKEDFTNFGKYTDSINLLNNCLQLISLANYPSNISFYTYKAAYSASSSEQILQAVIDEDSNLYADFFKEHTLPEIMSESPKVIGISILTEHNVIPGLTLAHMIKKTIKDVHIVIGGSFFTRLDDVLKDTHKLFSLFDSVILHEGETALLKLIECLEKGTSLDMVPNLIYKDGSNIVVNDIFHIENLDELPTPSFEGLPLNLYFSPEPVLPVYSSRGCYWGRCAFCSFHLSTGNKFRLRSEKLIIEDIHTLQTLYNVHTIVFMDEAIPPKNLSVIADNITENKINIHWGCHARFERQFDRELCQKLVKSGCTSLAFGLETINERVSKLMDKGTSISTIKEVLSNSREAGIANHITFFFGFPTETKDEALETLRFVLDSANVLNSVTFSHFKLMKYSRVYKSPKAYGVKGFIKTDSDDLALAYNYEVCTGMTQEEAAQITAAFSKPLIELFDKIKNFLNCHNVLYTIYYKTNNISWSLSGIDEKCGGLEVFKSKRLQKSKDLLFSSIHNKNTENKSDI